MISKIVPSLALSLTLLAPAAAFAEAGVLPDSGGLQIVHARDGRDVYADTSGLTIYTFDPDTADLSTCYGACAQEWPPVLVTKADGIKAPFGTTVRKDGKIQVTVNHMPVYLFDEDKVTGDILGDGDDGIWHVIVPAAAK
jgi:predicted lipoprotein with Yx(FWY)xxD motif